MRRSDQINEGVLVASDEVGVPSQAVVGEGDMPVITDEMVAQMGGFTIEDEVLGPTDDLGEEIPRDIDARPDVVTQEDTVGPDLASSEEDGDNWPPLTPRQIRHVEDFLPLVPILARAELRKWTESPWGELEEMIADGNLGLVRAARNFDIVKVPDDATNSANYFKSSIRGEILKGLRARYGRVSPTKKEKTAAAKEGVELKEKIAKIKPSVVHNSAWSLDAPLSLEDGSERTLYAITVDEGQIEQPEEAAERIGDIELAGAMLAEISPKMRELLQRRFWLNQTYKEIAEHTGRSQIAVCRAINKELARLRELAEAASQPASP